MAKFVRKLKSKTDQLYTNQPIICIQERNDKKPWEESEVH